MKIKLHGILRNNKVVFIISVLLAVAVWINISLSSNNESTLTVSGIPININLSDEAVSNGLKIFTGNDQTASVTITGNRVALGSVTGDDIIVSAPTAGTITTPDNYPLSLTAKKANSADNFVITSAVSPSVISVFVDYSKEMTFDIENKIKYSVAKGYHGNATLSSDTVTVSGPLSLVSKISSVAVEGEIDGELTGDAEIGCNVKLYDDTGSEISNSMIELSDTQILANIIVSPEKEVPLEAKFINKPLGLNVSDFVKIKPETINISGRNEVIDKISSVALKSIDFTTLENRKTTLDLSVDTPEKCINLSDAESAKVTIDLHKFTDKNINSSKFSVVGTNNEYNYDVTTERMYIRVIGPNSQIEKLSSSNLICEVDASGIEGTTGSISLPVQVRISGADSCWAYGKYKANVIVTKK